MPNVSIMGCKKCGGEKDGSNMRFGVYRVYIGNGTLKLQCRTCNELRYFKFIQGAPIQALMEDERNVD